MSAKIAIRVTGKKIKPFITTAGSVARGKELSKHPKAIAAQNCIKNNAGNRTAISACMAKI